MNPSMISFIIPFLLAFVWTFVNWLPTFVATRLLRLIIAIHLRLQDVVDSSDDPHAPVLSFCATAAGVQGLSRTLTRPPRYVVRQQLSKNAAFYGMNPDTTRTDPVVLLVVSPWDPPGVTYALWNIATLMTNNCLVVSGVATEGGWTTDHAVDEVTMMYSWLLRNHEHSRVVRPILLGAGFSVSTMLTAAQLWSRTDMPQPTAILGVCPVVGWTLTSPARSRALECVTSDEIRSAFPSRSPPSITGLPKTYFLRSKTDALAKTVDDFISLLTQRGVQVVSRKVTRITDIELSTMALWARDQLLLTPTSVTFNPAFATHCPSLESLPGSLDATPADPRLRGFKSLCPSGDIHAALADTSPQRFPMSMANLQGTSLDSIPCISSSGQGSETPSNHVSPSTKNLPDGCGNDLSPLFVPPSLF
eukprot:PhM_4_TR6942/c0_g1_i1/m.58689